MQVEHCTPLGGAENEALLTPEETAKWLGIAERTLLNNARRNRIPCVRLNERVIRFHRATVLASLQKLPKRVAA